LAEPNPAWSHDISIRHRIGTLQIDVDFSVARPWTLLFGPSGSGKTTILRTIAGLLRPDLGIISTGSDSSSETQVDTSRSIFRPPHLRNIRLAQQRPALFPHLNVLENVLYGVSLAPTAAASEPPTMPLTQLLAAFKIDALVAKYPAALSGGESQRVHLARTVAASGTSLLLLDEPFSGLDSPLRDSLICTLLAWQQQSRVPIFSVTHDVAEAFQLNAEVIKLADGPVEHVLANERVRLLAQLNAAGTPA
jgi:molybdate transport system ATP-binding protein